MASLGSSGPEPAEKEEYRFSVEGIMRVVLAACNAKYIHSNLAVYNLRACLRQVGAEVILREYTINQRKDEILRDLYECRADLCVCRVTSGIFLF